MQATLCDLDDTRGDDIIVTMQFFEPDGTTPLDMSGSTFASQLRRFPDAPDAIDFDADESGLAAGELILTILHAVAETLAGTYAWDLQQTTAGVPETPLKGTFTIDRDVTR